MLAFHLGWCIVCDSRSASVQDRLLRNRTHEQKFGIGDSECVSFFAMFFTWTETSKMKQEQLFGKINPLEAIAKAQSLISSIIKWCRWLNSKLRIWCDTYEHWKNSSTINILCGDLLIRSYILQGVRLIRLGFWMCQVADVANSKNNC